MSVIITAIHSKFHTERHRTISAAEGQLKCCDEIHLNLDHVRLNIQHC